MRNGPTTSYVRRSLQRTEVGSSMVLVRLLLRAICEHGLHRPRLFILPAVALVAAIGAVSATGAHPLHLVLVAGTHLLTAGGTLLTGGGPPNP